ncbi:MAG: hypothetical protein PF542_06460 [Nanoarchaeota archaeon]|jgi:hypothetical protein|nr:hypothetical protein [Nanoarchaeota archaeon]
MNKNMLGVMILGVFLMSVGFASAVDYDTSQNSSSMFVKVNVLESTVSISVPNNLLIKDMAAGYMSIEQGFDIINTGTTDIQVIPELSDSTSSEFFSNLGFKRVQADDLTKVGFFDVEILKPTIVGGERAQNVYAQLDLTEYDGNITTGENNATIIFTAVPL